MLLLADLLGRLGTYFKEVIVMDTTTMIVQEPPYGTEKAWNALRLAQSLLAIETHVNVFLLGDAVGRRGVLRGTGTSDDPAKACLLLALGKGLL